MEKKYITATDLMNYSYCPRIIYYTEVLRDPQFTTKKEFKGREKEYDYQTKAKRTKVVKQYPKLPKLFKAHLVSERLGIKTIVDSIMIDKEKNEAYPIQAKYSYRPPKLFRGQINQLLMEALLIKECLGYNVPFGFIKFLKSGDLVKVNLSNKKDVLELLNEVRDVIEGERFPKATVYKKRCIDCCYKSKCWG
ncbi:MAG: CRISPR-associated protein Cas4 [Candidatus Aenigmarchaeota archaeon]|nr:CRISPR-associated protein Cas4 [Candidatus Aenigmarchaeota archaeon]